MGAIVCKVPSKPIGTYEGRKVYGYKSAYKPYWYGRDADKDNARMAFQSGVLRLQSIWQKKSDEDRRNVLIASGNGDGSFALYGISYCSGAFIDDVVFDTKPVIDNWFPTKEKR